MNINLNHYFDNLMSILNLSLNDQYQVYFLSQFEFNRHDKKGIHLELKTLINKNPKKKKNNNKHNKLENFRSLSL
ncbi:hypothetical protein BpHYR1_039109 [Brachionus plicatilis]|uniref:Uncharacterized protein n=1 Tax=Brachionus plicatilis TaxID=10195 RepID=A0A3M7Q371_BRAPC|nr:hypothetical protein BpHYR1_039109 [Brachionus plicatilis]